MKFFQSECILCLNKTNSSICKNCRKDLFYKYKEPRCPICANLSTDNISHCGKCLTKKPIYNKTHVICSYKYPVDYLIKLIKFQKHPEFIKIFTKEFLYLLRNETQLPKLIIPMPLNKKRQQQRGFNQSLIFAKQLANSLNIKLATPSLIINKNNIPQSTLSYKDRNKNIKKAFEIKKEIKNKHIAIVDDVITTGSTVNELAKLIRKSSKAKIDIWAIAKTDLSSI